MKYLAFVILLLLLMPSVLAISASDQATFNEILEPVMKIYNLVKYVATTIACIMGVFAGITYITGGSDPKKRQNAKQMITYILIGLVIIWATPLMVNFVTG